MLTKLREVIEELEIHPRGDEITEAFALRSLLDARISAAVADFESENRFAVDYASSMVAWLRTEAALSGREANRIVTVARRLRHCPVTKGAWERGVLSVSQVQAIVANVRARHVERWQEHEAAVVPTLAPLSVGDTVRAMQAWARGADVDDPPPDDPPDRFLHFSPMLDGRTRLDGEFDAEGGSLIGTALRLASSPNSPAEHPRSYVERRADALVDICRHFLDHQHHLRGGRHRPHLNISVDLAELPDGGGRIIDGPALDATTISRILCDAGIHRCVTAGRSTILDYGTTTKTVPAPLWNALVLRDTHCRFPGCDRPAMWCEGHHVIEFPKGPTKLANLVLLCSRHHHLVHLRGRRWQLKLGEQAELHLTDPDGGVWVTRPPP